MRARAVNHFRLRKPGMRSVPVDSVVRDPSPVYLTALPDGFTGSERLVERIDEFLAGQPCGYVWIEADAGLGRTALAAHLARERGWVSHFSRYAGGGAVRAALSNLAAQLIIDRELSNLVPGRLLPEWAGTPAGFEALLARAARGERIVLVVDGAEEAVTPRGWQPWGLPNVLPPGVFVVGTYRTGTPPPSCDVPNMVIRAEPEDLGERAGDLRPYYLQQLDRWRDDDVALPVLATLVAAREALSPSQVGRLSGVDESVVREWCDRALRPFLTAGTTLTLEIFDAVARETWSERLGPVAAEAHGRIADHCLAHPHDDYSLRYLATHLLAAGRAADLDALLRQEEDGELVWLAAHHRADTLEEYTAAVTALREHYERLADEALRRGRLAPALMREQHYQLVSASLRSFTGPLSPRLLEAAVVTVVWTPRQALNHVRRLQEPADQIAAVALLAAHLPEEQRRAVVTRAVAVAEAQDEPARWQAIGTLSPHLTDDQLDHCFRRVVAVCDRDSALVAFGRIAPHLPAASIDRAFGVARWLALKGGEPGPLAALAPRLSAPQLDAGLSAVLSTQDPGKRVEALAGLLPHLSEQQRPEAVSSALEALDAAESDALVKARRLLALAPHVPLDQRDQGAVIADMHEQALKARNKDDQAALFVTLAEHLDPDQLAATRTAVAAEVEHAGKLTLPRARAALAAQLPAPDRDAVLDELLTTFEETRSEYLLPPALRLLTDDQFTRLLDMDGLALEYVATHGPTSLFSRVLDTLTTWHGTMVAQTVEKFAEHLRPDEAHRLAAVAATFTDAQARGRTLCAVGPRLSLDEQPAAASAALAALTANLTESYLVKLLPQLSVDELEEVLTLAHRLTERRGGAQLLTGLARTMPVDRLPEIRAAGRTLATEPDRGSVLNAVLSRLPPDERARLCEEEVEAATTNKYPYTILMWLAAYLPQPLHAKALGILRARGPVDEPGTGVLRDLAPHLSEVDLEDAVAVAQTAQRDDTRVKALAHLLPRLPQPRRAEIFAEMLTPDLPLDLVPHLSASELERACGLMDLGRDTVSRALLARAAELGEHLLYVRILRMVWERNDRNACLAVLNDCYPVLRELSGLEFGPRLLESLDDVHRWWR